MARFNEMTAEERKAMGRKGAETTNNAVKEQKQKEKEYKERKKKVASVREMMELLLSNPDNKEQLCQGLIESASKGNAKSAELILKIIGQDPNKTEQETADNPFE